MQISGPIRASLPQIESLQRQMKVGIELEVQGFQALIADSRVSFHELIEKALYAWYVSAEEARNLGLVAAVV